jgi:hypothetical protein
MYGVSMKAKLLTIILIFLMCIPQVALAFPHPINNSAVPSNYVSGLPITALHLKNPQYFILKNNCDHPILLGRSKVFSCIVIEGNQKKAFVFGNKTIDSGKTLTVYAGCGMNTTQKIYMGVGNNFFSGCHDSLTLYAPYGNFISTISV